MSYMIIRWNAYHEYDDTWHEAIEDNEAQRKYVKENGGEVIQAAITNIRTAHRIVDRLDDREGDEN